MESEGLPVAKNIAKKGKLPMRLSEYCDEGDEDVMNALFCSDQTWTLGKTMNLRKTETHVIKASIPSVQVVSRS